MLRTEEQEGVLTDKLSIALAQRFGDNVIISEILLRVLNQALGSALSEVCPPYAPLWTRRGLPIHAQPTQ